MSYHQFDDMMVNIARIRWWPISKINPKLKYKFQIDPNKELGTTMKVTYLRG